MTTLDLRGNGGTLRLAPNGGSATVKSFLVLGPTGPAGPAGPAGPVGPSGGTGGGTGATTTGGVVAVTGPALPAGLAVGTKYVWTQTDATSGDLIDIVTGVI